MKLRSWSKRSQSLQIKRGHSPAHGAEDPSLSAVHLFFI
jgi:hypothetical protein